MLRSIVAAALAISAVASCGGSPASSGEPATGTLGFTTAAGEVSMPVEIAETPAARRRGLMQRESLASDAGMAFLFDRPESAGFWMKDTLIPLSIAFWDAGGRIVAILDMEPCLEDPCPIYSPGATYVGAVEANQGFFESQGIAEGDRVVLTR